MKLSNKAYDALKFVALVLLPGLTTAYVTLGQIWNFPNVEGVVGTLVSLDTLLGLLLKNSTSNYPGDGDLVVTTDPKDGAKYLSLDAYKSVLDESRTSVQFQVVQNRPATLEDVEKQ